MLNPTECAGCPRVVAVTPLPAEVGFITVYYLLLCLTTARKGVRVVLYLSGYFLKGPWLGGSAYTIALSVLYGSGVGAFFYDVGTCFLIWAKVGLLSLIHISEPTRPY